LIETSLKTPEDGSKNFSRNPKFRKLSIDGAGIHFSHVYFQGIPTDGTTF